MTPQTLAYLSLAFVFAFTPGATTAVVIRHTLAGGRRRGLTASAGAMTASATQATLAVAGVSTLLVKWPLGMQILGIAGALFLTWMGIKSLRAAFLAPARTSSHPPAPDRTRPHLSAPDRTSSHRFAPSPYREGFAINILNPSVTSFYVGVTPTFVAPGSSWHALALLYAAHITIAFSCHVFWSSIFNQARTFLAGERPRRWLDGAVGVILLWLSYRIASRL